MKTNIQIVLGVKAWEPRRFLELTRPQNLTTASVQAHGLPYAPQVKVATPKDVKDYDWYINNGGDIKKIPVEDQLAVAVARPKLSSGPKALSGFTRS